MRRRMPRSGLTLIELLVVLGIISLLIAIILPMLAVSRGRAREVVCASKLKGFGQAMMMYANDNDGLLVPPEQFPLYRSEVWSEPVLGSDVVYANPLTMELSDVLVCPSDPFEGNPDPNRPTRNSYLVHSDFSAFKIQFGDTIRRRSASDFVVMGEKRPDAVGFTEAVAYSMSTPDAEWWDVIDLVRHDAHRSNYLFFDLHVDNRDLLEGRKVAEVLDPWP